MIKSISSFQTFNYFENLNNFLEKHSRLTNIIYTIGIIVAPCLGTLAASGAIALTIGAGSVTPLALGVITAAVVGVSFILIATKVCLIMKTVIFSKSLKESQQPEQTVSKCRSIKRDPEKTIPKEIKLSKSLKESQQPEQTVSKYRSIKKDPEKTIPKEIKPEVESKISTYSQKFSKNTSKKEKVIRERCKKKRIQKKKVFTRAIRNDNQVKIDSSIQKKVKEPKTPLNPPSEKEIVPVFTTLEPSIPHLSDFEKEELVVQPARPLEDESPITDNFVKMQLDILHGWNPESDQEASNLLKIWQTILQPKLDEPSLSIKNWELIDDKQGTKKSPASKTYQLDFEKEYQGPNLHVPGKFIIPQSIKMVLTLDEKGEKILIFPEQQLRLSTALVNIYPTKISVKDEEIIIAFKAGCFTKTKSMTLSEIIDIVKDIEWKK